MEKLNRHKILLRLESPHLSFFSLGIDELKGSFVQVRNSVYAQKPLNHFSPPADSSNLLSSVSQLSHLPLTQSFSKTSTDLPLPSNQHIRVRFKQSLNKPFLAYLLQPIHAFPSLWTYKNRPRVLTSHNFPLSILPILNITDITTRKPSP